MQGLNCGALRAHLIDLARGVCLDEGERRSLAAHLEACPDCARELEEQRRLTAALREVALAADVPAHDAVPARLLAEFDAVNRTRRRWAARWLPVAAGVVAAAVLAGYWWMPAPQTLPLSAPRVQAPPALRWQAAAPRRARVARRAPRSTAAPLRAAAQPFVFIPYTIPLAPEERTEVIRMDLPVAALIGAGLPLQVADPGAHAQADVLVGEDGRARAVRLISISTYTLNRQEN